MIKTFSFKAFVWLYPGMAAWHFVTLPKKTADEIYALAKNKERGFGSIPVEVTIGTTAWKTSVFPDKKSASYILPLKKEVRAKEDLKEGSNTKISLKISR